MKIINSLKQIPKILIFFVITFIISFIVYFYIQTQYIEKSEKSYINAIHNEVELLINIKKLNTFNIAQRLAIDKKLVNIMKNKQYNKLYNNKSIFSLKEKFKTYKHLWIHIVDEKGINRYLSWTKKGLGKYVLDKRIDLQKLYKNPHPINTISVGMFDITFKGIIPIYDYKTHKFLGIVEVISHFNSIAQALKKNKIYSALVIDKRFTKQLKYPFSHLFIDGYNISTLNLDKNIEKILKEKGIEFFIKNKQEEISVNSITDNYFVTKVDIKGVNNKIIAHYLIFIKDKNLLHEKEIILEIITIFMGIIFLFMSHFGFKAYIKNINLINSLTDKVKKETEKNLSLIYNDNLTKTYSKEKFLSDKELYKNKELVMLNIKNFSRINETYGFNIGDKILQLTAERLEEILERKIYRIDSDEFIFISDEINHDITHINHHFNDDPIHISKDDINIRISFSFSVVYGNETDTLRKLSLGIRQAKREPYKLYIYYQEPKIKDEFIKFNAYLYDAIFSEQNSRIIPYFQGIRNNKTGKIIKYESLARLEVNGEIYSPYYFIGIAKNSGFLNEITKIMIDKSFSYLSKHSEEITISINLTEDDLHNKEFQNYLLEKLDFYHLKPKQIILEILEGVSAAGTKNGLIQLKELKEAGFKLSIDDFGVEYSNFERINELDVDFIKIDGKYIKNIDKSEKSYKITKAIKQFAESMNIQVVAEFVENEDIQKIIEELGIEFSQGYCFSIPSKNFIDEEKSK